MIETAYSMKFVLPEEYIREAHTHLEDALTAMDTFINKSEPKGGNAESLYNKIEEIRETLYKYIRDNESTFWEITEDLEG